MKFPDKFNDVLYTLFDPKIIKEIINEVGRPAWKEMGAKYDFRKLYQLYKAKVGAAEALNDTS